MKNENYTETVRDIEKFVFENLPECSGIQKNVLLLKSTILENLELKDDSDAFAKKIVGEIDFYNGQLSTIFKKHQILDPDCSVSSEIQGHVGYYLFISMFKNFALSYDGIKKRLKEIEETSAKLQELLTIDGINGVILAGMATKDVGRLYKPKSDEIKLETEEHFQQHLILHQLHNASQGLNLFSNILSTFKETKIAEWTQFGKSGPKENLALDVWIKSTAELWTYQLGRNLSYSTDQVSGREKFLNFAEDCFAVVHPSLGDDAVRNAYEKLRSKGKLDYLSEISK